MVVINPSVVIQIWSVESRTMIVTHNFEVFIPKSSDKKHSFRSHMNVQ